MERQRCSGRAGRLEKVIVPNCFVFPNCCFIFMVLFSCGSNQKVFLSLFYVLYLRFIALLLLLPYCSCVALFCFFFLCCYYAQNFPQPVLCFHCFVLPILLCFKVFFVSKVLKHLSNFFQNFVFWSYCKDTVCSEQFSAFLL